MRLPDTSLTNQLAVSQDMDLTTCRLDDLRTSQLTDPTIFYVSHLEQLFTLIFRQKFR